VLAIQHLTGTHPIDGLLASFRTELPQFAVGKNNLPVSIEDHYEIRHRIQQRHIGVALGERNNLTGYFLGAGSIWGGEKTVNWCLLGSFHESEVARRTIGAEPTFRVYPQPQTLQS